MKDSFSDFKGYFETTNKKWNAYKLNPKTYECGYCGYKVSSDKGMCLTQNTDEMAADIYIYVITVIYQL